MRMLASLFQLSRLFQFELAVLRLAFYLPPIKHVLLIRCFGLTTITETSSMTSLQLKGNDYAIINMHFVDKVWKAAAFINVGGR